MSSFDREPSGPQARRARARVEPVDYFAPPATPEQAALRRIKGGFRRAMVENALAQGDPLDSIPPLWQAHDIPPELRDFIGKKDPAFRGGEDLPDLLDGEVEIARLSLRSVHCEVTSLRARPSLEGRFALRLVGEYEEELGPIALPQVEYDRPLTAYQVAELFRDADPSPVEPACGFYLSSDFYPNLDSVARELGLGLEREAP